MTAGAGTETRTALAVGLGGLTAVLDTTVAVLAVPALRRDFDAPLTTVQWVTTAYVLADRGRDPARGRLWRSLRPAPGLPGRTRGLLRRFTEGASCWTKVARVAQRVGLSVREIAVILDELPAEPAPGDREQVAVRLIAEARGRVVALERALTDLGSGEMLCELDPVDADGGVGLTGPG